MANEERKRRGSPDPRAGRGSGKSGRGSGHRSGSKQQGDPRRGSGGGSGGGRPVRSGTASIVQSGGEQLPRWVREALIRVTPKSRVQPALEALEAAAVAYVAGQYRRALSKAESAKKLAPRDATVRELLALCAYRLGLWQQAITELRTYRRMSGDTTHLPVEMDAARALERDDEVENAWAELQRRGASPGAMKEGRVVYGSFLLDKGELRRAWDITQPRKMRQDPFEEDLRLWYVAARAAAHLGDAAAARRIVAAITSADPSFPGLSELDSLVSGINDEG